jgi:hypothetical protein
MRNFKCTSCGQKIYFENVSCLSCGMKLAFDAGPLAVVTLKPAADAGVYSIAGRDSRKLYRYCANHAHAACNWLTPSEDQTGFCKACDLNRTIPNLAEPGSLDAWRELERAKKRLVYSLLRLGLPFDGTGTTRGPLSFDFLSGAMTGHADGVITIAIHEADAVERERQKQQFGEPYRSLLGHLRHESGHYYWMVLIEDTDAIGECRKLFGDEREDYAAALARHHADGPPADWDTRHVSAYAGSHPWEDWAETWAHYLHMLAAVDTAEAEGMEPRAAGITWGSVWPFRSADVYRQASFEDLMERWIPLSTAMNSLSRSMGHPDFYPFVIPGPAYDKLAFVHRVIRAGRR